MPDPKNHLIETAVRPLADDAEMKLAASQLLGELEKPDSEAAEKAIQRWNAVDAKKRWPICHVALYLILLVTSSTMLFREIKSLSAFRGAYVALGAMTPGPSYSLALPGKKTLTSDERLLLYGDKTKSSKAGQAKTLWDRHPENPAYFGEYAAAYLSDNSNLPPDFLDVSRRIDPMNAWFIYLAAGVEATDCVKKKPQSSSAKAAHETPEWEILDQGRLDKAMELMREARDLPNCNDYKARMMKEKIPLLRQGNQVERLISMTYLAGMTAQDLIKLRMLGNAIAATAAVLADEKKIPEFQSLILDSEAFAKKMVSVEPSTLVAGLDCKVNISTAYKGLTTGAENLGLMDEVKKNQPIGEMNFQNVAAYKKRAPMIDGIDFGQKSGFIAAITTPAVFRQVKNSPIITDADVKPGRLMEHEDLSMLCAIGAFLILGLMFVFVWAFRFAQGKLIRRVAQRMASLLTLEDWAWVMGIGIALPLAYVAIINRLTPLGGRNFSVFGMKFIMPTAHFVGLVFLIIITSVMITRWRIEKRAAVFGFSWKRSWLGWAAVISAAAFVIVIGMLAPSTMMNWIKAATLLLVLPVLWILGIGIRALLANRQKMLMSATVARMLVPVYASAMLLMILLIPIFKAAGQYWFEQDAFMQLDPAQPGMGTYEYKVAVQLQRETREILSYER